LNTKPCKLDLEGHSVGRYLQTHVFQNRGDRKNAMVAFMDITTDDVHMLYAVPNNTMTTTTTSNGKGKGAGKPKSQAVLCKEFKGYLLSKTTPTIVVAQPDVNGESISSSSSSSSSSSEIIKSETNTIAEISSKAC
jgi:hypothetical protein